MHDRVPGRPVDRLDHEAAESTTLHLQALDHRRQIVGRADAPASPLDHFLGQALKGALEAARDTERRLPVAVLKTHRALTALFESVLPRLGEVNWDHEPPLVSVHCFAMLLGCLFGDPPKSLRRLR